MDWLMLWPDRPALSIFVLWLGSSIFLWAARDAMLVVFARLGESLHEGVETMAIRCRKLAESLRLRSRENLLAAGTLEMQGKLDREFHRIDQGFTHNLEKYSSLNRRLDDLLISLDTDYRQCGEAPAAVPGWTSAIETIATLPATGDPNVHKVLEGIRKSLQDAEQKALRNHRAESSKRHKILGHMSGHWRDVRSLMTRMTDVVSRALETSNRINGYVDEYERLHDERAKAARARTYSAVKLFVVSVIVLGIATGGAFINFQLIALPMSELVPAGARIGGIPVATVSALVIVLMESALGFFLMDMLGITDLFPKLAGIPHTRRRMILVLAVAGLFFLAGVESSLAILREQIVEADAALKLALAGSTDAAVLEASHSRIPVIGQAILGFVLPWILALVAVPLEMLLDSGRHVVALLAASLLSLLGIAASITGQALNALFSILPSAYDVYISVPLRIEGMFRDVAEPDRPGLPSAMSSEGPTVSSEGAA